MASKDYSTIKNKLGIFVSAWKNGDTSVLNEILVPSVKISLNTASKSINESKNYSVITKLIKSFTKTDTLKLTIYNYVCRIQGEQASQYAIVMVKAFNKAIDNLPMDSFVFAVAMSNKWIKKNNEWKVNEMYVDIIPLYGNLMEYFCRSWGIMEERKYEKQEVFIPSIQGIFESPWKTIPRVDYYQNEEDQIVEVINRFAFGIDHWSMQEAIDCCSRSMGINAKKFGNQKGIRVLFSGIKQARIRNQYWIHPWRLEGVQIDGSRAYVKMYRMADILPTKHTVKWTNLNCHKEFAYAIYQVELIKEEGKWKILYSTNDIGLYELDCSSSIFG